MIKNKLGLGELFKNVFLGTIVMMLEDYQNDRFLFAENSIFLKEGSNE